MEDKDKKKLIVLVVILVIVVGFNIFSNSRNGFDKFLANRGFYLDDDKAFYYKQISDTSISDYEEDKKNNVESSYDYMYFDKYSKKLSEVINEYYDKYESSLNLNYKFSSDKLNYVYRINYEDVNMIIKGSYDNNTDEFKCDREFFHSVNITDKQDFCDNALYYIKSFYTIKDKIFTKEDVKKILNNKK